jgi:preprotein translocase subunit SecY
MTSISSKIQLLTNDRILSRKLLFVLGALVVFRFLSNVPIPAVGSENVAGLLSNSSANDMLGFLNLVTGGGLSSISIMMLGVGPYITSSIIMQLVTMMSPKLKAMYHEEGELGRKKFMQLSRKLTVPLAMIQGSALIIFLQKQGVVGQLDLFSFATNIMIVVAGSILLMWIGELISEYGIGNGVSLIIFAGIVAQIPSKALQMIGLYNVAEIPMYLVFLIIVILATAAVVYITEAERPIPVTYAKQVRGGQTYGGSQTYLPLRVNQAGVIPIIFALSLMIFPKFLAAFLMGLSNGIAVSVGNGINAFFNNTLAYSVMYFILVFAFTFFYTAVTFDPESIATNLQKNGAFIPGIRPGHATSEYIGTILTRITLVGAAFLGAIAVLPFIMQALAGSGSTFAVGGTALLIVVSVVLDLVKRIEAQLSMRAY